MIVATIKSTGAMIDRPRISYIQIPNIKDLAIRRMNEETNELEQFTIEEIFDSFDKKSSYRRNEGDRENTISTDLFESWFMRKYISGKGIQSNIISIEYKKI